MPSELNFSIAPFNTLTANQKEQLTRHVDIAYFRENDIILHQSQSSESLYIIIKGVVEERSNDSGEIYAHYTHDDIFDARSQLEGSVKHCYHALEDTLCHLIPTEVFLSIYHENADFSAYFNGSLAKRKALLTQANQQQNLAEFILTKIDDDTIQTAISVDWNTSLKQVTHLLKEHNIDALFVELNQYDPRHKRNKYSLPIGIITRTDLLHALVLNNHEPNHPVGPIATYPIVSIQKHDYLFNAMTLMTRHHVKRVAVLDSQQLVGMLDMTQVLSLFSTHSHVLTLRIARAQSIEELAIAANSQTQLINTLLNNGIRTRFIMELISTVNEQIIEKAFSLTIPKGLHDHCCLIVMGSEGRGEQILKTDQDNALIIKNGLEWHQVNELMTQFTQTLLQLGYPLCKGNVMVSNPHWVKTEQEWQRYIERMSTEHNGENMMNLAIFSDAQAVAGNRDLLTPLKQSISHQLKDNELALSIFTRPALQFTVPLTLFGNVKNKKEGIDIKQGGIFPIVHGIRALALEQGIEKTNTFQRIEELNSRKVLEHSTADNLTEALKLFFKWRLRHQLKNSQNRVSNYIHIEQLDRTERDLLRHSLHVVKKFKEWLGYHYQIRD
ncbi:putative nucleotidyltransferase substrate binding domain-containing protein [Aliivibrio sp. S4TY2]|uniref:putative nucleotidyltransferase substrate binding domain-containing protein n=1 Tax=unclassified Aliivibrio TaxID=2645654 RepID=UPI002378A130|nr:MULTISPECIES: putative nucleotidyltransferase substrate binding domain-containing protein [unclassified Aliivibrio]MDD9155708.1 putative nucleotidyltransferase substrate binding domain-containing protein [Aliivibrio sp. S4TY2]MDD9159612.1 putative nucleotidyltransferase substrate binding domain-containing protein [Aliivibrio sp. S4TY1]MDD9163417.1 putative nucleotidyltransferase substrate binding domain-containing protein [Aliivibrio sp. S4MY2]MDD9167417.1 putative nucleotidyltransferase sub